MNRRRLGRLTAYLFTASIIGGCAPTPAIKDDRPLPMDDPEASGIVYLIKASTSEMEKAASEQLRSRYGQSSVSTGVTGYGTPYWHLSTRFREYEVDKRRLRSQCSVHCYPFKEFPQYVKLNVSCKLEQHGLRYTFHGFPSRDWHSEQGLYLALELMTDIVREAAIPESRLIRLRRDPSYEESITLIGARERGGP